jgi:hypothetical protein
MGDTKKLEKDILSTTPKESSLVAPAEIQASTPEQQTYNTEQKEQLPQKEIQTKKEEGFLDETIEGLKTKLKKPKKQKPKAIPQVRDKLTVKVEKIMEEGLVDAFKELDPVERQEFKMKGEETALEIRQLLKSAHVKIKKIFKLLFGWLKMLPGINRFYLEQEAKIKADKIVSLKDQS